MGDAAIVRKRWADKIENSGMSEKDKVKFRSVDIGEVYTIKDTGQNCIIVDVTINLFGTVKIKVHIPEELNSHLPSFRSGIGVFGLSMKDLEVSKTAKYSDLKTKSPETN